MAADYRSHRDWVNGWACVLQDTDFRRGEKQINIFSCKYMDAENVFVFQIVLEDCVDD